VCFKWKSGKALSNIFLHSAREATFSIFLFKLPPQKTKVAYHLPKKKWRVELLLRILSLSAAKKSVYNMFVENKNAPLGINGCLVWELKLQLSARPRVKQLHT